MLRKLRLIVPILLLFLGIWYFFLKEYDYTIRFDTPTSQGHIYQKINAWKYDNIPEVKVINRKPFKQLQQKSKNVNLNWKIKHINDSLSNVSVGVNHKEDKFKNRFQLLFKTPVFQKKIIDEIQLFKDAIEADKNLMSFSIGKETNIKEVNCACISLESKPEKKAYQMMGNIGYISDYLLENNLKMSGKPRVHITKWNKKENYINFDFCFPLKNGQDFPETSLIFIKKIPGFEAKKGIYTGNYMFTHYFWPNLLKTNPKSSKTEILEVFNDNPEMGGDATTWEAELYLLKN